MVNWFPFQYVGLSRTNNKYRAVRTAAQNYAAALNAMNKAGPNQNALRAAKENHDKKKLALNAAILAYMRPTSGGVPPTGAPPAAGNVQGRMQLPRNGKINGALVSNSSGRNFTPGNVYKVGSNFYAAGKTRNGAANIWVPASRADRLNPFSKRFVKMMISENKAFNKVVNANGKVSFVQRGTAPIPKSLNRLAFGKFMMLAPSLGRTTPQNQAKNYLNGNNRYKNNFGPVNFNAVRRITRNTNTANNAGTRKAAGGFWNAVTAEMTRRAGIRQPFVAWYGNNGRSGASPNAKANAYLRALNAYKTNPTTPNAAILIKAANNNKGTTNRAPFWTAVNAKLAARPSNRSWYNKARNALYATVE